MASVSISINWGIADSARASSPLTKSSSKRSRVITLFCRRRDGELAFRGVHPLIALFDQHDGNIIHDWILASAIPANEPRIPVQLELAAGGTHTIGTAQDLDQGLTNHSFSISSGRKIVPCGFP